jgi:hypothetical protein
MKCIVRSDDGQSAYLNTSVKHISSMQDETGINKINPVASKDIEAN